LAVYIGTLKCSVTPQGKALEEQALPCLTDTRLAPLALRSREPTRSSWYYTRTLNKNDE